MLFDGANRPESQNSNKNKMNRLGTTFHRSFWLSRPQIRQLLSLASSTEPDPLSSSCLTAELIREQTQLGTVQVEAMPRYARACGLLDEQLCLTPFGKKAYKYDSLLETMATKWLMHYFISTEHGFGPPFWSYIISTHFKSGDELEHQNIAETISQIHLETNGKQIKQEYAKSTSTIFLKTYIESDALGDLGILQDLGDGRYLVQEPDPPSVWVFGIALLDYWEAHHSTKRTINLDDLYTDGGLGDIFLMGGGRVNSYLRRLEEEGIVELYRVAPPYQLVLLQRDPQPLLERLYAHDEYI